MNILRAAGRRRVPSLATRRTALQLVAAPGRRCGRPARTVRSAARAAQSRHGPHLDSLAGFCHRGHCRDRQSVLHRRARWCWHGTWGAASFIPPGAGRGACVASGSASPCSCSCCSRTSCSISGRMPRATAWLVLGYFGLAHRHRRAVLGRVVLQAPVPDRAVQLHGLDAVADRAAHRRSRDLQIVPDVGLHQGTSVGRSAKPAPHRGRATRLRARTLPADEGREPGLHAVPRLRARLPARQHRTRRRERPAPSS